MKIAGTLKLEIIKPINTTWEKAGDRMRILSRTLAPALSCTQRLLWPGLHFGLEAIRTKQPEAKQAMQNAMVPLRKTLKKTWNEEIAKFQAYAASQELKYEESAFAEVIDCQASETEDYIISRWTGDHLKDLLANRSSVPSWTSPCAFFMEGRHCEVSGPAKQARIRIPLWGAGKKATEFAVAPCGHGHMALWDRLTGGQVLEGERARLARALKEAKKTKSPNAASILHQLEKLEVIKLGKVGVVYNDRKRKWYALVTWTQQRPEIQAAGELSAVCNFGVNRFLMVVAEGGKVIHDESGQHILAVRKRFSHRRRELQKAINTMGSGSKGRGVKRRMKPITDLEDKEQRFCDTASKQIAAEIAQKCRDHGIGTLYIEDLTGIRDSFERETLGEAHESLKSYIHSWGYFKLQQHLDRACELVGTNVKLKPAYYVSQDCPDCGHRSPDNIKRRAPKKSGAFMEHHGRLFYDFEEPRVFFECGKCGQRADGDLVACTNHLKHLGFKASIKHVQSERFKETGLVENPPQPTA
jgi:IS605 OrfB family transposase